LTVSHTGNRQELGYVNKDSVEAKLLFYNQRRFNNKKISDLYFEGFDPNNYDKLIEFFDVDIHRNINLFQPFIKLKDAATFGDITPRRLAEILAIDVGDADELVRYWDNQVENEGDEGLTTDGSRQT